VPSLFKRKSADVVTDVADTSAAEPEEEAAEAEDAERVRPRGYTPSKRELGRSTPKRRDTTRRRAPEPPPANRREALRRSRARRHAEQAERREGMLAGDERYMLPRDRGPERALVRDIVDSRFTIGTWFFAGALIVIIGSSRAMPPAIQLASNLLWALLAAATVLDSLLIVRRIKKEMRERFPNAQTKLGSLYLYGAMRGLTFRRMRMPKPRVKLGEPI
jgi:hypothetical protein